jgi:hypothetical protein
MDTHCYKIRDTDSETDSKSTKDRDITGREIEMQSTY